MIFWYGVVLVVAFGYVMAATPLGRRILFVGANREVARLAGIPVTRVRVGAWLTSSLLCGVAGVVSAAGLGGFNATSAREYFLPAFASVFLGTVAVVPGRFNPLGMFVAVYFLITGIFGLQLLGYQGWVTDAFYGVRARRRSRRIGLGATTHPCLAIALGHLSGHPIPAPLVPRNGEPPCP